MRSRIRARVNSALIMICAVALVTALLAGGVQVATMQRASADDFVINVAFGSVPLNHSRTYVYTVQPSLISIALPLFPVAVHAPFQASYGTCGLPRLPCDIAVTYKPTSVGTQSQDIAFRSGSSNGIVLHVTGSGVAAPVPASTGAYWPGSDFVRGVAVTKFGDAGYTLDAYGGLHVFTRGTFSRPPTAHGTAYWPGFRIARGVALLPDDRGGYVLDGYGGLHPFSTGSNPMPPRARGGPYWSGRDLARGVTLTEDGQGGYIVDAMGGVHSFAIGRTNPAPPAVVGFGYWPGRDVARGLALGSRGGGLVIDGAANEWTFYVPNETVEHPRPLGYAAFYGDLARGIDIQPVTDQTFVVDMYGGVHERFTIYR